MCRLKYNVNITVNVELVEMTMKISLHFNVRDYSKHLFTYTMYYVLVRNYFVDYDSCIYL